MERNPDINDEDIGIRTFQLKKEQASERAIEKIRHNLRKEWHTIFSDDIELLRWVLGEMWALVGHYEWDHFNFSAISLDNIKKIILISKDITAHKIKGNEGFKEIEDILRSS